MFYLFLLVKIFQKLVLLTIKNQNPKPALPEILATPLWCSEPPLYLTRLCSVMMWNCLCGYWMSGPSVSLCAMHTGELMRYPIWTGASFKGDVGELRPQSWPYGRHAEEHFVSGGEKQEATLRQFWSSLLIFSHISSVFLS